MYVDNVCTIRPEVKVAEAVTRKDVTKNNVTA